MPDDLTQRELLARIDERTSAHYHAFLKFEETANKRLDAHAEKIRALEGFNKAVKGVLAFIVSIGGMLKLFASASQTSR